MNPQVRSAAVATAAAVLASAGCGGTPAEPMAEPPPSVTSSSTAATPTGSGGGAVSPTPNAPAEDKTRTIEVTMMGDEITPKGQRVEVQAGEPVIVNVTSDRAGEFHVHSTPEQTPTFRKGTSTVSVTIDTPGVVDVEEHESGMVVVQLEVR